MRTTRTNMALLAGLLAMSALSSPAWAVMHPTLGPWTQRDPAGYADGMNRYAAYHVMRGGVDPSGQLSAYVWGELSTAVTTRMQNDVKDYILESTQGRWPGDRDVPLRTRAMLFCGQNVEALRMVDYTVQSAELLLQVFLQGKPGSAAESILKKIGDPPEDIEWRAYAVRSSLSKSENGCACLMTMVHDDNSHQVVVQIRGRVAKSVNWQRRVGYGFEVTCCPNGDKEEDEFISTFTGLWNRRFGGPTGPQKSYYLDHWKLDGGGGAPFDDDGLVDAMIDGNVDDYIEDNMDQ